MLTHVQDAAGSGPADGSINLTVVDVSNPVVTQVTRNDGNGRYDLLTSLSFTFSDDIVSSLNPTDLSITDADTGTPVVLSGASVSWTATTKTARWTLGQTNFGIGRYQVRLTSITDSNGNPLDGNGDGTGGDDFTHQEIVTFAGDAELNFDVQFGDFVALADSFGQGGKTWQDGDFTGDGTVQFDDFVILANNFGMSKPMAAPAVSAVFAAEGEAETEWWLAGDDDQDDLIGQRSLLA